MLSAFFCWLRGGHRWNRETVKVPKHLTPTVPDPVLRTCQRCGRGLVVSAG